MEIDANTQGEMRQGSSVQLLPDLSVGHSFLPVGTGLLKWGPSCPSSDEGGQGKAAKIRVFVTCLGEGVIARICR